eukprot:1180210-Prorocentrum_minimum.AAC.2
MAEEAQGELVHCQQVAGEARPLQREEGELVHCQQVAEEAKVTFRLSVCNNHVVDIVCYCSRGLGRELAASFGLPLFSFTSPLLLLYFAP